MHIEWEQFKTSKPSLEAAKNTRENASKRKGSGEERERVGKMGVKLGQKERKRNGDSEHRRQSGSRKDTGTAAPYERDRSKSVRAEARSQRERTVVQTVAAPAVVVAATSN
jgi:hypothetical protein